MADYKRVQGKDGVYYVTRLADGAVMPESPHNRDYNEYTARLAVDPTIVEVVSYEAPPEETESEERASYLCPLVTTEVKITATPGEWQAVAGWVGRLADIQGGSEIHITGEYKATSAGKIRLVENETILGDMGLADTSRAWVQFILCIEAQATEGHHTYKIEVSPSDIGFEALRFLALCIVQHQ